jgi:apolipoprotein N-acyltransferase
MASESMASSSRTVQPISKITADESSTHGLTAITSSQQQAFGSSQTLIAGASTAGTLARFLLRSFNIDCVLCGRFIRKSLSHSALLPTVAATTSAIAWSGHIATIPFGLLAPLLLYHTQSRAHSYATLLSYYVGASWPLIPGASTFFGARGTTIDGILICFGASTLLGIPGALLFTHNRAMRPFAIAGMFVLTALPPLGIIGWASPFISAGVLFPGTSWLGLLGTLALVLLLGRFLLRTVALAVILAFLANTFYKPPSLPKGWQAVNTEFGGTGQGDPDFLAEFEAHEQMQETVSQSNARVLLFPEHVVTQWTEATDAFWRKALQNLAERRATILIGVGLPRSRGPHFADSSRYYNALLAKDQDTQAVYYQRIPVPLAMWKPLTGDGVPLNLFGPGTMLVQNQRAAVLICYEQLLVWPFLASAFEHPTVLITTANDYWAKRTPIPKIQNASTSSLARLFRLPVLSAVNE